MSATVRISLVSGAVLTTFASGCFVDPIGSLTTSTVDTSGAPGLTSGGPHAITLRNREPINADGHVARIARLLITNDLAYVPTADD